MSRKPQSVVIVGRDAALWLTALGLQRAFGRTGVTVHAVELPSALHAADVYPCTPTVQGLHNLLDIPESEVLAGCSATYSMAQRYANWSKARPAFMHAYDTYGSGFKGVDFIHYWVRARAAGMKVALDDFSLGAAAAKVGRLVNHSESSESFSNATYGYNLDARAYVQLVRRRALKTGVRAAVSGFTGVSVRDGGIESVRLGNGEALKADLYVDASGAESVLIGRLPDDEFESWSRWLPCDRMLAASTKRFDPIPAFSEIAAFRVGWYGLYPLQDRTAVISVFDSSRLSDRELGEAVSTIAGVVLQDAVASPLAPGVRRRPWNANCVAVGEAAVSLEPLDAIPLHLVHLGLSQLVTFFPVDAEDMIEAPAYNAAVLAAAANLRDFQAAHYKLNQRHDEELWDHARAVEPPDSLAYKLDLFAARGHVALYDDETFQAENWMASFIGHGLIPRDYDPLADLMAPEEQIQNFQKMLAYIAAEVRDMPSVQARIELAAPRSGGDSWF